MGKVRVAIVGEPERRCPHADVQHCPLYIAAHGGPAAAFMCLVGDWSQGCAVDRGEMKYGEALAAAATADPLMIARALESERARRANAQRRRNMLAAGLRP